MCSIRWAWLLAEVWVVIVVVVVVDGAGFSCVRDCGRACWSRCGWSRVLLAPLAWRYPSGFAGVSFATVSGLGVGWSACCLLVAAAGVDGVSFGGVRGCGCSCWPRCGSPRRLLMVVVAVGGAGFSGVRGCGYVRWPLTGLAHGRGWCRWSGLFVCLRLWLCSMAEGWVVVLVVVVVDGVFHKHVR